MIRRILAMAWKESIHIRRDFRTLYLAIIMPVMMILLFGYAIDFDINHIAVGVCDLDNSMESRSFLHTLDAGEWFDIRYFTKDQKSLESALDRGVVKIGIFIPPGFAKSLKRGELAEMGAILDGSDNNAATVGYNYLQLFMARYQEGLASDYLKRNGLAPPGHIEPVPLVYFNPELKSRYYILPGIIALTMAILSALLTSLAIAREWERGSMEQLISTPVRSHEIILGKLLPYIGLSLIQVVFAVSFAVFLFHIPFEGHLFSLFYASLLFAVGALGLGLLLSSVLKAQLPAMQVAFIASMLPSILLSNFVFPIDSMPAVIRMITYIVPAKYFLVMLRTIFLKGTGFMAYLWETLFLSLYSLLILTIATKRLVKRVA